MSDSYTQQHQNGLEEARKVWLEDLGESIPCVTVDFFEKSVLPLLPEAAVDSTIAKLKLKGAIKAERWTSFPKDPAMDRRKENDVFRKLPALCEKIMATGKEYMNGRSATLKFQASPTATLNAEADSLHASYMVDGSAVLLNPKGAGTRRGNRLPRNTPAPTSTMALRTRSMEKRLSQDASDAGSISELKKFSDAKSRQDNVSKIIGAATHMMFNDPCRRFTFGMTIEDTNTRFWFFSRFLVMVSLPFNFITEQRHLIHWVLSLGFATEVELGYDPTIERVYDGKDIQYDIRVGGVCYRTIRSLDNHRASRLIGRATRVWEVVEKDDPTKHCVIKDVWIGNDARSELDILTDIFSKVNTVHSLDDFENDYQEKYFMKIDADECVNVGDHEDRSPLIMRGNVVLRDCLRFSLVQEKEPRKATLLEGSEHPTPLGATTSLFSDGRANRQVVERPYVHHYEAKQHRRVLMPDLGSPLGEILTDHKKLFHSLAHVLKGMRYLYSAGYVHRDISTGNLLLCDDGSCKMSDFEYARIFEEAPGNSELPAAQHPAESVMKDFKTGTPAFMAFEVQMGRYNFIKAKRYDTAVSPSKVTGGGSKKAAKKKAMFEDFFAPVVAHFRHNYLHDVESLWWIGEWAMFTTLPASSPEAATQPHFTDAVFPHSVNGSSQRFAFILDNDIHKTTIKDYLPSAFWGSLFQLSCIRVYLLEDMESFETNTPGFSFGEIFSSAYPDFLEAAKEAAVDVRHAPRYKVPPNPAPTAPKANPSSSKRAAPEGGEAQGSAGKRSKKDKVPSAKTKPRKK